MGSLELFFGSKGNTNANADRIIMSTFYPATQWGNFAVRPGTSIADHGDGSFFVAGSSILTGAVNMQNNLSVTGVSTLSSSLTANGSSTFNAPSTFNDLVTMTGSMVLANTTNSTSSSTGALSVRGGFSVLLNTNLGGTLNVTGVTGLASNLTVGGTSTLSGVLTVNNTTEATAAGIGAAVIAGGMSVAKSIRSTLGNLYLADELVLSRDGTTGITSLASPTNDLYINSGGSHNVLLNDNSTADFTVGGAVTLNSTGLHILSNTDSTSTTDGSFTTVGGMGIAGSVNVGGAISGGVNATLTFGNIVSTNTAQSSSIGTGAVQTLGGMGIAKNTYIGGILDVASGANVASNIGNIRLHSAQSGANWIKSGDTARTAGNWTPLKFAPLASTTSIFTINSDQVTVDTATASTSPSTGSLVTVGGAGIGGDLYVNSTANFGGTAVFGSNAYLSTNNLYLGMDGDTGSGLVYSNATTTGPFLFGSTGGALGTTSGTTKVALSWDINQAVQIKGTAESTSATTGGLTVLGGVGLAKNIFVGGAILLQDATLTTSTGSDLFVNAAGATVSIRNSPDAISGEFETTLTDFNFRTLDVTTPTPISPFVAFNIIKESGVVRVLTTTQSTGVASGAFQVLGGASISKDVYVGGNHNVLGNLTVAGSISATGNSPVVFSNTTASTSPSTGAVVIAGGTGIGGALYVGDVVGILGTTPSTDPTTGAFTVVGGAGIGGDTFIGGSLDVATNFNLTGTMTTAGVVSFTNTTAATSPTVASVLMAGGLGVSGAVFTGGAVNVANTTASTSTTSGALIVSGGFGLAGASYFGGIANFINTANSTAVGNGSIVTAGGAGIAQDVNIGGSTTIGGSLSVVGNISSTGGTVAFTNTTDSTSPLDGAVTIAGGLGIGKSAFIGSTTDSTSPATGALVVSGGAGFASSVQIGGSFTLAGTTPVIYFNNDGLGAPSYSTRSAGTKVVYHDNLSTTAADYAVGMEGGALWYGVPMNDPANSFHWYGGAFLGMNLDGTGVLTINGTDESSSTTSGALVVKGGAAFAKSAFVGAALNVGGTSYFNGAMTANTNVTVGGILSVTNTTQSTLVGNGSIITAGGLGVALNANIGGNMAVTGNTTITGNVVTSGTVAFQNATEATSTTNAAVTIVGGLGMGKDLHVGGNAFISQDLTVIGRMFVQGNVTAVDSQITTFGDNILLVNSAPAGTASAGFGTKRYQMANDVLDGDVVNSTPDEIATAQAGGSATTVVLSPSASTIDGYYNGAWISITGGTGSGQVRRINTYIGATRTATIYTSADQASLATNPIEGFDWTTVPDATSTYNIFTSQYVMTIFDETSREYVMGYSTTNPTSDPSVPIRGYIGVHAGSMRLTNYLKVDTINSYTANAGVTVEGVNFKNGAMTGVISFNNTTVDVTTQVSLLDSDTTGVVIPSTNVFGAYSIFVGDLNDGAYARFDITNNSARSGQVNRVSSTRGGNEESLYIHWPNGSQPRLKWDNPPNNITGATYTFKIKVSSL